MKTERFIIIQHLQFWGCSKYLAQFMGEMWKRIWYCGFNFSTVLDIHFPVLLFLYQHCKQKMKMWKLILASPSYM